MQSMFQQMYDQHGEHHHGKPEMLPPSGDNEYRMLYVGVKTRRAGVAESCVAGNRRVQDAASTYVLCPCMGTGVSWNLEVRSGAEIT